MSCSTKKKDSSSIFKCQTHPKVNIVTLDVIRGHKKVKVHFLRNQCFHWISCGAESKEINFKCQTQPDVNFGILNAILRSFGNQSAHFLKINVVQCLSC